MASLADLRATVASIVTDELGYTEKAVVDMAVDCLGKGMDRTTTTSSFSYVKLLSSTRNDRFRANAIASRRQCSEIRRKTL